MNYQGISNQAIQAEIGRRLQRARLDRNLSQDELAAASGLARRTITNVENGKGGSLDTLISYLRGIGMLDRLDQFVPEPGPSPVALLKLKGKTRQRATGERGSGEMRVEEEGWTWNE